MVSVQGDNYEHNQFTSLKQFQVSIKYDQIFGTSHFKQIHIYRTLINRRERFLSQLMRLRPCLLMRIAVVIDVQNVRSF